MSLVGVSATASRIYRIVKPSHDRPQERLRNIGTSSQPVEGTTGATSSEWERSKSLAERAVRASLLCVRPVLDRMKRSLAVRAVRALPLCVRSMFDRMQTSLAERAVRTLLLCVRSVFDRMKRSLAEGAVRALLLCVRSELDWIHQASTGCNDVRRI